jgi:hypothetical protein
MTTFTAAHLELPELSTLWNKILKTLNDAREIRNKLAHGAIGAYTRNGRTNVRLTGPQFQAVNAPRARD